MKTVEILMEIKEQLGSIETKLDKNCEDTHEVKIQATKTNGKVAEQEKKLALIEQKKQELEKGTEDIKTLKSELLCMRTTFGNLKWLIGGIGTPIAVWALIELIQKFW